MAIEIHEDYFRSLMFGFQDGLVSTTGVVVGIATGTPDKAVILLRQRPELDPGHPGPPDGRRVRP